jgi:hypothetical protein
MSEPSMMTYRELRGDAAVWPGNLDRSSFIDSQFQAGMYLDDCAKAGNWDKVLKILDPGNHLVAINQSRPRQAHDRRCCIELPRAAHR